ncbi:MAG: spore coat polysaccharide biosynthesis protein SpsF (cytidylyltransferase family) [Psychroserpens sp.]
MIEIQKTITEVILSSKSERWGDFQSLCENYGLSVHSGLFKKILLKVKKYAPFNCGSSVVSN